jgi:hypothetical protein
MKVLVHVSLFLAGVVELDIDEVGVNARLIMGEPKVQNSTMIISQPQNQLDDSQRSEVAGFAIHHLLKDSLARASGQKPPEIVGVVQVGPDGIKH